MSDMGYARKRTLVQCKACGKEWMKVDYTIQRWSGFCRPCSMFGERNHFYGKTHTETTREKISGKLVGTNHPGYGKTMPASVRKKIGDAQRGEKSHSFGRVATAEERKKMSESRKGLLAGDKNPMYGKHLSEEQKRVISENSIKYWRGRPKSEAHKKNLSASIKALWKDPDYQKMVQASRQARPNKFEGRVFSLLNDISPKEFRYSGDFSVWINGKNPDFISTKRNVVVEANGDYWHTQDENAERIRHFDLCGYKCLIVREGELKNNALGVRMALESSLTKESASARDTI